MSITIDDFKKIWASTSSVPEYTFSDSDYQDGWEFVGNMPPTRAMWDTLQRRNDQKMKYLQDNGSMCFDSVADMVASNLESGQTVITKGYYSVNDGGSALYTIRAKDVADVDDGGGVIFLANGKVAELITENTINVKQFGAKGDGINDDSVAINKALEAGIGRTVYLPAGTYLCSTHRITAYSCTEMRGEKGKTILQRGYNLSEENTAVLFRVYAVDGETTIHDITVKDIIFDGNGRTYDARSFDITFLSDFPTENLVIDGCDFLDCIDYHAIDLQQCSRTIIRNCRFMGWKHKYSTDSVALMREAIQFDAASNDSDETRNNHIIIENCYFGASDTFGAYPCAIGNHGFGDTGDTVFFNNVVIRDCTFKDLTYYALHLYIFNDVIVESNHCEGGCFIYIQNADTPNTGYANKNVVIQNNNIVGNSASYSDYAIFNDGYRASADESRYFKAAVTNLVVQNNYIAYYAKGVYIKGNGCIGTIIEGNSFEHCGDTDVYGSAVDLRAVIKSVKVLHNIIKNSGVIWASNDISISFTDMLSTMSDFTIIGNSFIDPFNLTRCIHIDANMRGVLIKNNMIVDSTTNRGVTYAYVKVNGNLTGSFVRDNYIYTASAITKFYDLSGSGILLANNYNYINNVLSGVEGDEYLPLRGGTLTGGIRLAGTAPWISTDSSSKYLRLLNVDYYGGASLYLYGKDADTNPGGFALSAYDGTNRKELKCFPDGTITWGDSPVAVGSFLPLSGGTMTGPIIITTAGEFAKRGDTAGYLQLLGGTAYANGASLVLSGKDYSTQPGQFMLRARDASGYKDLLGKPDGTLGWGGQPVLHGPTASFGSNGYFTIQHSNTVVQWRRQNIGAGKSYTWTFAKPFGGADQYTRFVSSENDCTVTATATTMTVTNNGSATAEVNMLVIGLMAS